MNYSFTSPKTFYKGKQEIEERFTYNLPDWPTFDKWGPLQLFPNMLDHRICDNIILLAPSLWGLLLLPIILTMGPFHGATINWFAHKYGYTNFRMKNTSQNLFSVDILMLGESYHNNHHKHPSSINFGKRWHEFDPVYPMIRFFAWLRIIKLNK